MPPWSWRLQLEIELLCNALAHLHSLRTCASGRALELEAMLSQWFVNQGPRHAYSRWWDPWQQFSGPLVLPLVVEATSRVAWQIN